MLFGVEERDPGGEADVTIRCKLEGSPLGKKMILPEAWRAKDSEDIVIGKLGGG